MPLVTLWHKWWSTSSAKMSKRPWMILYTVTISISCLDDSRQKRFKLRRWSPHSVTLPSKKCFVNHRWSEGINIELKNWNHTGEYTKITRISSSSNFSLSSLYCCVVLVKFKQNNVITVSETNAKCNIFYNYDNIRNKAVCLLLNVGMLNFNCIRSDQTYSLQQIVLYN